MMLDEGRGQSKIFAVKLKQLSQLHSDKKEKSS